MDVRLLNFNSMTESQRFSLKSPKRLIIYIIKHMILGLSTLSPGGGGGTWVDFCCVCAAGLSEPLPHYSLFCDQL